MEFEVPDGLRYAESHEWADRRGDRVRVGISDFAQDELGDIVFVDLPSEGENLDAGDELVVVESIKAVSDVYAPVSGTVVATNDELDDRPDVINEDPYDGGWMVEIESDHDLEELLPPSAYRELIES